MSIKLFTVKCPVHGTLELTLRGTEQCPERCLIQTDNEVCNEPVKRVYDAPAIHYKGSGWAGKES